MKKTVLAGLLLVLINASFSQNSRPATRKGSEFIELKNPSFNFSNNSFNSNFSLGYGKFLTNRLNFSANANGNISSQFGDIRKSLGLEGNFQYYFTKPEKKIQFYGKISSTGDFGFGGGYNKTLDLSLNALFGAEYFINKKTSIFFELGGGNHKTFTKNWRFDRIEPKASLGFRFHF